MTILVQVTGLHYHTAYYLSAYISFLIDMYIYTTIPAVRLTCIACLSPISQSILTDFYEIWDGLFASHLATTLKFSLENIV